MTHVMLLLYAVAVAGIVFMSWACWVRAHDGSMTSKPEILDDISADLEGDE